MDYLNKINKMYKSLVQYFNILLVFGLAAELFVVEAKSNVRFVFNTVHRIFTLELVIFE